MTKAVVIGAGVAGLSCAARLAKAGVDVVVVEKQAYSGGRCSLLHNNGHRFDRGPSLYLMPETFRETFGDLGEDVDELLELRKCEPNYRLHYADGDSVDMSTDMTQMKATLQKYEGTDGFANFLSYLAESHRHYHISVDMVLHSNFETIWHLLRPSLILPALRLHIWDKMYRRATTYFKSDKMRKAFTFAAMYMGMSPFDSPATYSLLQYTEIAEGIWYPVGGFHAVPAALQTIGEKLGVRYHFSCPVQRIDLDPQTRRAKGVVLEGGEVIEADLVLCNADLLWAYSNLLPRTPYAERLLEKSLTSSSVSFYWSMKRTIPELRTHNIFLAEEYKESFDAIFKDFGLPTDVSFYVNVPSRIDPSAAPKGKDSIVVLCPIGIIKPGMVQDWDKLISRARRSIIERISTRLDLSEFGSLIDHEMVSGPLEWRKDFNLHRGSILGLSHNILQVLWFRPATRHAHFSNVYFCGASTQPGTGVPIVLCGAKMVAEQILGDLQIQVPWKPNVSAQRSGNTLWMVILTILVLMLALQIKLSM